MRRVTIAVLTFHREISLQRALASLAAQELLPAAQLRVLVVDNSPAGTAQQTVAAALPAFPHDLLWLHEPTPGIVSARNAAVRACGGDEALLFLDDDEEAPPSWAATMLACQRELDADAVAGPVINRAVQPPPSWIREGGYFDRPRHTTGTSIDRAPTGNLLLARRALRRLGPDPFDERFSQTGGEDSFLTQRLVRAGGSLVWCDEAEVVEHIGPERCRPRWVFRRAFRTAGSSARCRLLLADARADRLRVRTRCVVGGAVKAATGAVLLVLSPVVPGLTWHRALRLVCVGAGLAAGAVGHVTAEYRR